MHLQVNEWRQPSQACLRPQELLAPFGFLALVKPANQITGSWYNMQICQMFSTTEIYRGADHLGAVWNEEN